MKPMLRKVLVLGAVATAALGLSGCVYYPSSYGYGYGGGYGGAYPAYVPPAPVVSGGLFFGGGGWGGGWGDRGGWGDDDHRGGWGDRR